MITREPSPYFACRGFCNPKGNGKLRFVIDMRPLNAKVCRMVSNLPSLEMQLALLEKGHHFFGSLDHLSGFDMLPIVPKDTKYLCIVNSPTVYQDRVQDCLLGGTRPGALFGGRIHGCNQWIDDSQP